MLLTHRRHLSRHIYACSCPHWITEAMVRRPEISHDECVREISDLQAVLFTYEKFR
jgi:hypothetical protein